MTSTLQTDTTDGESFLFKWHIKDFSKFSKAQCLHSDKFYCNGSPWLLQISVHGRTVHNFKFRRLRLSPQGVGRAKGSFLSFHLRRWMGQQGDQPSEHFSKESDVQILKLLACNFVNSDKEIVLGGTFEGNDMQAEDRGSSKFIPIDRLQLDGFVVADTLIVGAGISRAQWSLQRQSVDESNGMIDLPVVDAVMASRCSRFFNKRAMSDVEVIASTGESFFGHRIVLAQQSRAFCALFEKDGEGNKRVQLLEANGAVLGSFLKYLYGCTSQVDVKDIVGLCALAERFEVTSLHAVCVTEIRKYFEIPMFTCLIYNELKRFGMSALQSDCFYIIVGSLHVVKDTNEFCNLGLDDIQKLVASQLRPISEKVLIDAVLKWADQSHVPERQAHVASLLRNVTFHALSAKEMMEVRRLPVIVQSTELLDLLLNAYEALWAAHCGVDLVRASEQQPAKFQFSLANLAG